MNKSQDAAVPVYREGQQGHSRTKCSLCVSENGAKCQGETERKETHRGALPGCQAGPTHVDRLFYSILRTPPGAWRGTCRHGRRGLHVHTELPVKEHVEICADPSVSPSPQAQGWAFWKGYQPSHTQLLESVSVTPRCPFLAACHRAATPLPLLCRLVSPPQLSNPVSGAGLRSSVTHRGRQRKPVIVMRPSR